MPLNSRPPCDSIENLAATRKGTPTLASVPKKSVPFPNESDLEPRPVDLSQFFVVRSLNCTSNKPLHLGHLRNMVLGAAMAQSLETLGARVLRHCILEDTGRFVTEAMAAVRSFERSTQQDEDLQIKSDHFIGLCYRRYRQKIGDAAQPEDRNSSGNHELAATGYEARSDEADNLMHALMRGEADALQLRAKVRQMALAGQQATLQRIAITFDRCDYESAEDPALEDFLGSCSALGLLQRNEKGELAYSASNGYRLRLINSAGLAEESTRLLSFNKRLSDAGITNNMTIVMAGSEWKKSMTVYAEILARLGVENISKLYHPIFYGMVMLNGKKMASSTGTGLLVDDLIDKVAGDERIRDLARQCANDDLSDEFAVTIAKCFLLSFRRTNKIDFTFEFLNSQDSNPGWLIATAWAAIAHRGSPRPAMPPSLELRRVLLDAVSRISFEDAVEYAKGLAVGILKGTADDEDDSDFITVLTALSVVPRRSEFSFSDAPSLGLD